MKAYQVRGTNDKVHLLEITVDGIVKIKNIETHEIFETTKQAFEIAFEPCDYSFPDLEIINPDPCTHQITQSEIDDMIKSAHIEIVELFGRCTIVAVQLANGFILTESATSIDTNSHNKELNIQTCLDQIKKRIWDLEGYKNRTFLQD